MCIKCNGRGVIHEVMTWGVEFTPCSCESQEESIEEVLERWEHEASGTRKS